MLVYFTASALICVTALQLSLYFIDQQRNGHPIPILSCILWAIPFVIAIGLLIKSKAVAQWISDKFE